MIICNELAIVPYDQLPEWDAYVDSHSKGTIFHTSAMIRAFESTKRFDPFALAAVDKKNQICALLVACKISTLGKWADSFAARSVLYAEPIYDDSESGRLGLEQLLSKHDDYMRRRTLFAEVRPFFGPPEVPDALMSHRYERLGYRNYELDLRKSAEELFREFDPKCRNNIRSSLKRGLVVREVKPMEELDNFYGLLTESYSGSKVPLTDRSHFESVFRQMSESVCRLFIAEYGGKVVASACFLAFKDRVVYWYAGAKRVSGIAGMSCILWDAIAIYSAEGYRVFDFAGAGWEGEAYGPGRFKAKFGGVLTNYGRYRKVYSPWKLRCATSTYQTIRGWLAPTPRSV